MHYRIKGQIVSASGFRNKGHIVAQVAIDTAMSNHCERWVDPLDVLETIPSDRIEPEILALFERKVTMWD